MNGSKRSLTGVPCQIACSHFLCAVCAWIRFPKSHSGNDVIDELQVCTEIIITNLVLQLSICTDGEFVHILMQVDTLMCHNCTDSVYLSLDRISLIGSIELDEITKINKKFYFE